VPPVILLDTFPLSSIARRRPHAGAADTELDRCRRSVRECIGASNHVVAPAIAYYETLRELERLGAGVQISRLRTLLRAGPSRYLSLTDESLELAARLWAQARNAGTPTAGPEALDGDVILAVQALGLGLRPSEFVGATTNAKHLSRFVPAEHWTGITP
jgi:predicted nucleic acid-binding protein